MSPMDFPAQLRHAAALALEHPNRMTAVLDWYERLAREHAGRQEPTARLRLGQVRLQQGNLLAQVGVPAATAAALDCYALAVDALQPLADSNETALAELAAAHANAAQALQGTAPGRLGEAARRAWMAVETFLRLPWRIDARYAHNLAAACVNLADIEALLDRTAAATEALDTALRACDALADLRDPRHPLLAAQVWLERGNLLVDSADNGEPQACLSRAEDLLRRAAESPARNLLLATVLANAANLHLRPDAPQEPGQAAHHAREALVLLERVPDQSACAELAVKAAWALCRAIGGSGEADHTGHVSMLAEISDTVDTALDAVARWHARGVPTQPNLIAGLFRCAADACWQLDPQFLPEFIGDALAKFPPGTGMGERLADEARAAFDRCIHHLETTHWVLDGSDESAALLDSLEYLHTQRAQLGAPVPTRAP